MFEFHEDSHYVLEADFECLQPEIAYSSNRKSSFIDLLSYCKPNLDPHFEEALNIEHLSNEPFEVSSHLYFTESEPIKLLLDDFPDIILPQKSLDSQYKTYIATLNKTYQNVCVGTLTTEERRKKIEKYLAKKNKRTWKKKIHYDCRKKVADNRLRIKGRFVTRNKAITFESDPDSKKIETNIT